MTKTTRRTSGPSSSVSGDISATAELERGLGPSCQRKNMKNDTFCLNLVQATQRNAFDSKKSKMRGTRLSFWAWALKGSKRHCHAHHAQELIIHRHQNVRLKRTKHTGSTHDISPTRSAIEILHYLNPVQLIRGAQAMLDGTVFGRCARRGAANGLTNTWMHKRIQTNTQVQNC